MAEQGEISSGAVTPAEDSDIEGTLPELYEVIIFT